MRFSRFAQTAAQPPAPVFQVSNAGGLDIVRDLGRHGVPVAAFDAAARQVVTRQPRGDVNV